MENFCKVGKVETRTVGNLSPVLKNPKELGDSEKVAYDVCRGEKTKGSLRYDVTRIHAERIGGELPKTFGHYHSKGFIELFEVIEGKSLLMLQKNETPEIVSEVYLIEVNKEEKALVLANYGFTNINPEKDNSSLISNWIDVNVENQYDIIKNFHGLCYYVLEDKNGSVVFEKNPNYKKVPELIRMKPRKFPAELEDLDFLSHPEKYSELLTIDNLYEKL